MKSGEIKFRTGEPCWYFTWSEFNNEEHPDLDNMINWCIMQFGSGGVIGTGPGTGPSKIVTGPSKQRWGQGLSTFFFTNLEDALMFRLTWDN